MQHTQAEVVLAFFAATIVLVGLVTFIVIFAVLFQRRQQRFRHEKEKLRQAYEHEIMQAQVETQRQTLQYVGEELHDHIGQLLTVVSYQLNGLEDDLAQTPHQPTVQQSTDLVAEIINSVRQLSKSLNSQTIERFGLVESIKVELERIQRTQRFTTHLQVVGTAYLINPQATTVLFRMIQESLNNAMKHSGGNVLTVRIHYAPATLILSIIDNGKGFSQAEVDGRALPQSGSGLANLKRRAALMGGTYQITGDTTEGTTVTIQLPSQNLL